MCSERKFAPRGRPPRVSFGIPSGRPGVFVLPTAWQPTIATSRVRTAHDNGRHRMAVGHPTANYSAVRRAPLPAPGALSRSHFLNRKTRTFGNLSSSHILYLRAPPAPTQLQAEHGSRAQGQTRAGRSGALAPAFSALAVWPGLLRSSSGRARGAGGGSQPRLHTRAPGELRKHRDAHPRTPGLNGSK